MLKPPRRDLGQENSGSARKMSGDVLTLFVLWIGIPARGIFLSQDTKDAVPIPTRVNTALSGFGPLSPSQNPEGPRDRPTKPSNA